MLIAPNGLRYENVDATDAGGESARWLLPSTGRVTSFIETPALSVVATLLLPSGRWPLFRPSGRAANISIDQDGLSVMLQTGIAVNASAPPQPETASILAIHGTAIVEVTWLVDGTGVMLSMQAPDETTARARQDAVLAIARGLRSVDESTFRAATASVTRGSSSQQAPRSVQPYGQPTAALLSADAFGARGVLPGTNTAWEVALVGEDFCGVASVGPPLRSGTAACGQQDSPVGVVRWGRTVFGAYVAVLRVDPGVSAELRRRDDDSLVSTSPTVAGQGRGQQVLRGVALAIPDMVRDAGHLVLVIRRSDGTELARTLL